MTSKLVEKNIFIELLADRFKEVLNKIYDLRADYDDDQTDKIELGRELAKKVWKDL